MQPKKIRREIMARKPPARAKSGRAGEKRGADAAGNVRVSPRWLLSALALTLVAAALCGWCVLCLLFWQGSWQLLYHPAAAVTRSPASVGLPFDAVEFAPTDAGAARLKGWWIPAAQGTPLGRFTVLFLHGQNGNRGDTVDALARLHTVGVNVLVFDYRGYGESQFVRPSEAHWREDAEWALDYLTGTRHVDPGAIVLDGEDLGANLALEIAAAHSELAGVVVETPTAEPLNPILNDARARLVPARLLVRDRYDLDGAARALRIPSLWILSPEGRTEDVEAYRDVRVQRMAVWTNPGSQPFADALARWLDELATR